VVWRSAAEAVANGPPARRLRTSERSDADRFPVHMRLAPRELAWSYVQRSGRIDPARLRKISPKFVNG
jgi:hypothetical protein